MLGHFENAEILRTMALKPASFTEFLCVFSMFEHCSVWCTACLRNFSFLSIAGFCIPRPTMQFRRKHDMDHWGRGLSLPIYVYKHTHNTCTHVYIYIYIHTCILVSICLFRRIPIGSYTYDPGSPSPTPPPPNPQSCAPSWKSKWRRSRVSGSSGSRSL